MISTFIAIAVLAAAAVLLIAVRGRAERDIAISARAARITGSLPVAPTDAPDAAAALAAAEAVGSAMIQAGYSVETVQDVLGDIARVNGLPESEVLVFPNALLVSARGQGQHRTGAVASGDGQLLLSQIDEVQRTVDAARTGVLDPRSDGRADRAHPRRCRPPTAGSCASIGYAFLSAALSVLLGASWTGVSLAAGARTGHRSGAPGQRARAAPLRRADHRRRSRSSSRSRCSCSCERVSGSGILAALLAPLVVLLPGALLTTAVLELSTGQMISGRGPAGGRGRCSSSCSSAGIVTAGALVGVPDFDFSEHPDLLGPIAPWIAVAVFGVAISVHRCAPRRSIPWILLVLYVAYSAQVLGDLARWAACSRPSSARWS